ncbi:MAG: flagellar basal body rod protein FlgB [Rhodospirillales bacterium]|nr:flagellar basal body rod protein FlgB [Rhodospirillales bacterium]
MDFGKIAVFEAMKKRLSWLSHRQEVLAQNIANADTPNYKPRDLKPIQFKELVARSKPVSMATSNPKHLGDARAVRDGSSVEISPKSNESSPNGNAVVLEEQVSKINENSISYRLTTQIYKKHLSMFRIALGK